MDGREQLHERLLVFRPGILAQGLAQRLILHAPLPDTFGAYVARNAKGQSGSPRFSAR